MQMYCESVPTASFILLIRFDLSTKYFFFVVLVNWLIGVMLFKKYGILSLLSIFLNFRKIYTYYNITAILQQLIIYSFKLFYYWLK